MVKTSWFIGAVKHKPKKVKADGSHLRTKTKKSDKLTIAISSGNSVIGVDPEQEREPVAAPTPVSFPICNQIHGQPWTEEEAPPNLQSLFSRVIRPTDLSDDHLWALNIEFSSPCAVAELVPDTPDGSTYCKPPIPPTDVEPTTRGDAEPVHTEATRRRKDFDDRLTELRMPNDVVYQILSRRVPDDTKPPRIAYMRKFYEGLESMSRYWDCSRDKHYESNEICQDADDGSPTKRQKLENGYSPIHTPAAQLATDESQSIPFLISAPSVEASNNLTEADKTSEGTNEQYPNDHEAVSCTEKSPSPKPEPQLHKRYKGLRTSTGREMPDQFRIDTVRAFVEGTIWSFHASLATPRVPPMVRFHKLNLPVRQTAAVYRMPKDRIKGRAGWQEGPILSLQVRADTEFQDEVSKPKDHMCRLDQLREIAGLLQLAQERRREGRAHVRPGEGQWWTQKPRWGRGPGGEVQSKIGNDDVVQMAEEVLGPIQAKKAAMSQMSTSKNAQRKTPALLWKELKVGKGNWDPKTEYMAIGKDPTSDLDEVFQVSSLNHHISIMKLTVHGAYVDCLTTGTLPRPLPDDVEWSRPELRRTQWFDLFDVEQRVEAFRALWGVMAYLTRDTPKSSEAK